MASPKGGGTALPMYIHIFLRPTRDHSNSGGNPWSSAISRTLSCRTTSPRRTSFNGLDVAVYEASVADRVYSVARLGGSIADGLQSTEPVDGRRRGAGRPHARLRWYP